MSGPWANPFVGLRPFESDEALLFFGRDEQTLELLERLQAKRFLAVVGSSGCGKSSLVRAGLLSKLRAAKRDRWRVATLKPGSRPFTELATVLAASLPGSIGDTVPAFADSLRVGGLTPLLGALAPIFESGDTSLLLVIDQFEEIFRFGLQSGDESRHEEATEFVALLLGLARQTAFPIYVVITLRSDFLGDCDAFRGLPEALNESQYLVPRLPRDKRQEAIEGPVRLCGKRIAPRLVNRLLNDGGAAPDQLPVLQHALMRVWEKAGNAEELDIEHYEAAGGLAKALSKHAGEALADLEPNELSAAKKLFQALTTTDANNRQIRRPRTLGQLVEETGVERGRLVKVIDAFRGHGRSFLMPPPGVPLTDGTLVDISHESLIRQWETLREWVDVEAESGKVYQRLAEDAERYTAGKGNLLVDRALAVAQEWRSKTEPTEAWAQRYSRNFAAAMAFLAESEQRDRRVALVRLAQYALVFLLLPVSMLSIFSFHQWRLAREKAFEANFNLAKMFEEKAGSALKDAHGDGTPQAFPKAWLFSLAAVSQPIGSRLLPDTMGRLLTPDVRNGAFRELWRSPLPLGAIRTVAFSPDGRRLASGTNKMIRIWDVATGQLLATLQGHSAPVLSVAFSPDGRSLASGAFDQTIRLWDVETGRSLATLQEHSAPVSSVAFSPDGRKLASASYDHTIRLWNVKTGQSLATLQGHSDLALSVAFSPDGRSLASASSDHTIRIWEVATGQSLATLKGHTDAVLSVAFSPDGRRLASASSDHTVRIWEVKTWRSLTTLQGHSDQVWSVAFGSGGQQLASGSSDQTIRVWDVATGRSIARLQGHSAQVLSVVFSPDGRRLASGSLDRTVRLWDVVAGPELASLQAHSSAVWSVAFSPDGHRLASASDDRTIRVWDVATGKRLASLLGHSDAVFSVAFSPDGRRLASASDDRTVRVWDVATGKSLATLQGHSHRIRSVAFSPDGRWLASGSFDRTVRVWDWATGRCLATLQGHSDMVLSVAFSSDGRRLASASADRTIRIWDVVTGKCLATLLGHSGWVLSVAFSPDGQRLASASADRTIRTWDVATGKRLLTLQGHSDRVRSVAFSPGGRRLASGSDDRTIRIWDVATGQNLATVQGSTEVGSAAFSPEERRLASGFASERIPIGRMATEQSLIPLLRPAQVSTEIRSRDGRLILVGDQTIGAWNMASAERLDPLQGPSIAFSPDGRRLASGSLDGRIRFWFTSLPGILDPREAKADADAMAKIYRASLEILRYRPAGLDFEPRLIYPSLADRPRPLDKDLLEWLLEVGEKLPETPQ